MSQMNLQNEASRHILLVAHRGVSGGNIPCNTIAAFKAALDQNADMIELDVGRGLDGTLYVLHEGCEKVRLGTDTPLGRMTDAQIREMRYLNTDGAPTQYGINTLDETLDFLKGKCFINVDKFDLYPDEIIRTIRKHDMMEQIVVKRQLSICSWTSLRRSRRTCPISSSSKKPTR